MRTLIEVLVFATWWVVGYIGYLYWIWRVDGKISLADLLFGLPVAVVLGPIVWLIGWSAYGHSPIVFIRKSK